MAFDSIKGYVDLRLELPCGQCVGCRAQRAADWAIRCVNEASVHAENSFVTLTYNDEFLPKDGGLRVEDLQRFFKRVRRRVGRVRYFACGEYGDQNGRPHFHACVFGHGFFGDRTRLDRPGKPLFQSRQLDELWSDPASDRPLGFASVGALEYESAAYVARYVMKKLTGKRSEEYGERRPPFVVMSLKPGIGASWFTKYQADVFPSDEIVHDGRRHRVPRYYDQLFEASDAEAMARIKMKRAAAAHSHSEDQTYGRLRAREGVAEARARAFGRKV